MKLKRSILFFAAVLLAAACKKENNTFISPATVNVINAAIGASAITVNPTGQPLIYSRSTDSVRYGTGRLYFAGPGLSDFTAVLTRDTTKNVVKGSFMLNSKMNTLYIIGQYPDVDTLFKQEREYPIIRTDIVTIPSADSVVNVRFVNLSVGSPALKVKLATGTVNEVDNLPYKGIGNWKAYPAKLASTAYSFQIRRVDNDALLTTFSFTANATNRFKNVTLIIRGVFSTTTGTAPFGVSTINYF